MVRLWSVDKGVLRDNCGSSRTLAAQLIGCLASWADQRSVPYVGIAGLGEQGSGLGGVTRLPGLG
jgi:hypothetical protein